MPRLTTDQRLAKIADECARYGCRFYLRFDPDGEPYAKWRARVRRPDGSLVWDVRAGSAREAIGRIEYFLGVRPQAFTEAV